MGSSAKKKKEKKKDFQKAKLKVGKTRPKNTNATDTSFSAKSIVFKQQNLSETGRDIKALFDHNLSLLSSKNETQRRDALQYLTTSIHTLGADQLPQPPSFIVTKAQPLILDGSSQVRQQLLKLFRSLPATQLGEIDQLLLYTRAGMAHLSDAIRSSSLDILDWLLEVSGETVVCCPGSWVKTLGTFQNLLAWHYSEGAGEGKTSIDRGKWTHTKTTNTNSNNLGNNKLLVHQLNTLSRFLAVGLTTPSADADREAQARRAAQIFPLWNFDAYAGISNARRSNPYGYLNLFGAPRDVESEGYDDPEQRAGVFTETGFLAAFRHGVGEARKEGGEVGRAAAAVQKSLRLVDDGG